MFLSEEAIQAKEKIKKQKNISEEDITSINLEDKSALSIGYRSQRNVLDYIYQVIAKDRKQVPEEIHKEFLKSQFTGSLMPIARLIENSFGKGSFRELGNMDIDNDSCIRTVESLRGFRQRHKSKNIDVE
jgi:hypothetical protein